jgi:hypothetical protein
MVNSKLAGVLNLRGTYDASGNTFPASGGSGTSGAILKGDMWFISVGGTLNGDAVTIGDVIFAKVDAPAQVANNWSIINVNVTFVPENVANKENLVLDSSTTKYPTINLLNTQLNLKQNVRPTKIQAGLVPFMTAATGSGFTISASSEYDSEFAGWKAFDGSISTDWATNGVTTDFWIKVALPSAKALHKIAFARRAGTEYMSYFVLQGSNDDTTWVDLHNVNGDLVGLPDSSLIVNSNVIDLTYTKYLYYRFFCYKSIGTNPGSKFLQLYEFNI